MAKKESYLLRDLKAAAKDARTAQTTGAAAKEYTRLPRLMLTSLTPRAGTTTLMLALAAYFAESQAPPRLFTASPDPSRTRTFAEILSGHTPTADTLHPLPAWLLPGSMARFLLEKHAGAASWSLIEAPMGLLGSPNLPQPERFFDQIHPHFTHTHTAQAPETATEQDTTLNSDDPDTTDHPLTQALPTGAAATLALNTACPVVFVVDVQNAGLETLATLKGLIDLIPGLHIAGLILNRVPLSQSELWTDLFHAATGLPILFTLPELPLTAWPDVDQFNKERTTMGRTTDAKHQAAHNLNLLTEALKQHAHLDVRVFTALADRATPLPSRIPASLLRAQRLIDPYRRTTERPFTLAITRDAAFTDTYADNLELFTELGAELHYLSPLEDTELPPNLDGLYLTGGPLEHYLTPLSANTSLHMAIRKAATHGLPIMAEGEGFLYLSEYHIAKGKQYPMLGLIPGNTAAAEPGDDFRAITGYVRMVSRGYDGRTPQGDTLRVFDPHHYRIAQRGQAYRAQLPGGPTFLTGHAGPHLSAITGYSFGFGAPAVAARFAKLCYERHRDRTGETRGRIQPWK